MIAAWEWGAYLGADALEKGIKIRTSSYTRHHVNISMCKAKANGHYINSMLALQEALSCGYDEAMLLDNEGYVAEGSGENIFVVRDGVRHRPGHDQTWRHPSPARILLLYLHHAASFPIYPDESVQHLFQLQTTWRRQAPAPDHTPSH